MSTQYRLVQSGKTASGGCSAGQGSSEPVAPRILFFYFFFVGKYFLRIQGTICLKLHDLEGFDLDIVRGGD
jgi:hypothetical protein